MLSARLTFFLIAIVLIPSVLAGRTVHDCRITGIRALDCSCGAPRVASDSEAADGKAADGKADACGGCCPRSEPRPATGSDHVASVTGHADACACCDVSTLRWIAVRPDSSEEVPLPSLAACSHADAAPLPARGTIRFSMTTRGPTRRSDPPIFLEVCSILR